MKKFSLFIILLMFVVSAYAQDSSKIRKKMSDRNIRDCFYSIATDDKHVTGTWTFDHTTIALDDTSLERLFVSDSLYADTLVCATFTQMYDAAAYWTATQANAAGVTFNSVSDGTAGFTFSDDVTFSTSILQTKVNSAGGSANPYDYTGTLGIMNGDDDFTLFDINMTNADHTGSNTVQIMDIANITGDAHATENAVQIGTGWDLGLKVSSPVEINGIITLENDEYLTNAVNGTVEARTAVWKQSFDTAAYWDATVADGAGVTFDATSDGTAGFTFSDLVTFSAGINTGTSQTIRGTTALTLGAGAETVGVNSSDWDISATGVMTGIGNITTDGDITMSTGKVIKGSTTTAETIALQVYDVNGAAYENALLLTNGDAPAIAIGAGGQQTVAINSADWDISTTGAMTGIGAITTDGLATLALGATISGATTSINASSNFATNINTGSSTGAVTVGGGSGTVAVNSSDWDITTVGDVTGLGSVTMDGALTLSQVNAAGGSAAPIVYGGTLGIMNTDDAFALIDVNLVNADHTGTGNTVRVLDVANITGDAHATETAVVVGTGWDLALQANSPVEINGVITLENDEIITNAVNGTVEITAPVLKQAYDAAAYWTATQADGGAVTFASVSDGTAGFTFSQKATFSAGIDIGTSQAVVGTTAMTIGDNGQTVAVNSSDWDVSTTGDLSGIGSISADGALTLESSRTGGASVQNSYKMTLAAGESFSGTTGHIFKVYDADNTVVHNGGEHTGVYVNMKQLSAMQAGGKSVLFSGHNYGSGGDYQIIDAGVWLYGNLVDAYKISGGSIDTGLDLSETAVTGQDLHLHNGATINNVHADTLTITESVLKVAGGLTFKNSPAISFTKIVQSKVASGKERALLTIGGVDYLLFAAADSADFAD